VVSSDSEAHRSFADVAVAADHGGAAAAADVSDRDGLAIGAEGHDINDKRLMGLRTVCWTAPGLVSGLFPGWFVPKNWPKKLAVVIAQIDIRLSNLMGISFHTAGDKETVA
jgi:hypothetical protein